MYSCHCDTNVNTNDDDIERLHSAEMRYSLLTTRWKKCMLCYLELYLPIVLTRTSYGPKTVYSNTKTTTIHIQEGHCYSSSQNFPIIQNCCFFLSSFCCQFRTLIPIYRYEVCSPIPLLPYGFDNVYRYNQLNPRDELSLGQMITGITRVSESFQVIVSRTIQLLSLQCSNKRGVTEGPNIPVNIFSRIALT